jgi:hypothetical protein
MRTINQKIAADDQIEGAFFQLAYQRLQDTLKNLIPYLIGFEIAQKNEDNTKALGLFGFRSNNGQILYVPAFFVNGKVKGLDLLYSKNNEQFYPLNEDFAEMFIKDELVGLGQPSHESRNSILKDVVQGDYRQMAVPPRTGKVSIASVVDYAKDAGAETQAALQDLIEKDAEFCEAMLRFYPIEKIAEALVSEQADKGDKKTKKVKVVTKDDKEEIKGLADSDKKTLLSQGYVIVDSRATEEKSNFGAVQHLEKFTNPTESGFYTYITKQGGLQYGLILVRPKQLQQDLATDDSLVIDIAAEDGTVYIKDSNKVFIKDQIRVQEYDAVHKMMVDVAEGKPDYDSVYVLINESLQATQPFRINANFKDASGIRRVSVEPYSEYDYSNDDRKGGPLDRPGSAHALPRGNYYDHPKKSREVFLVMTKRAGKRLEYKADSVYVPSGYKLLKLRVADESNSGCCTAMPIGASKSEEASVEKKRLAEAQRREREQRNSPGSPATLHGLLTSKSIFPMTVHTNGSEYFVDINGAKKKYEDSIKAKIGMVLDLGFDEKVAAALLDELIPGTVKKGHVKLAYLGDVTPQPYQEVPYMNEFGQPTTSGIGAETMLPQMDGYTGNPTQRDLGTTPEIKGIDPRYVQQAVQMASNGQKEIFDAHMIGTLAKYVGVGDKITEYLPSLVEAMDRLGRILFLLHWETDKFKEMYGRGDLPELVELVTNVLKNTGDLVIFLKRKSPELSINMTKTDGLDV